ncbi:MAG: lysophospholipase [Cyanosarcina radialis HA8281-LM2]|nr:lysophospholipase [Cyanosarcina radialis HA8281-LM2]
MRQKFLLRGLLGVGLVGAIAYLSVCLLLYFQQSRLIFVPSAVIEKTPEFFNLKYEEVWLPVATKSGRVERIHGWWIPSSREQQTPGAKGKVLLYLHGNGINIGANVAHANRFHQLGFSVLLIDYRGYGLSEGSFPTEASVYEDAAVAWNYLVQQRQISPDRIFIYGHSLGGAVAIDLAVKHPEAAGLIVESSFTSIREMVDLQKIYSFFPIDLILQHRFESIQKVRSLQMPVIFFHGTLDPLIPSQMSEKLFAAAPEPKQLILIPGARHNNVAEFAGDKYLQAVRQFIERVEGDRAKLKRI